MSEQVSASGCKCGKMAVLGVYETARLENIKKLKVKALIDSGATTTAMDARNIRMYVNRKGRRWVYYDFRHKSSGKTVSMHQPVSRVARVITHSGSPTERAVVKNTVSIGKLTRFVEMSLINRSNFPQQLLIGRNFLSRVALIDSGKSHLQKGF
ncbi:MAG: ATP-dependent zinc protease family protein [Endozoicomonas sp.]